MDAKDTGVATLGPVRIFSRKEDPQPLRRRRNTLIETIFPTVRFRRDLAKAEDAHNARVARYRAETEMKIASLEAAQRDLKRKLMEKEMQNELMRLNAGGKAEENTATAGFPQTSDEQEKLFAIRMAQEVHDLRNPLTTIMGAAMALESEDLSANVARLVDMMVKNAQKMKGMIEDTLQCTKLLRGTIELNKKSYDAARQLSGIVEGQTLTAHARKKEISFESSLGSIHICGDKRRLGRVFENLISNAIKNCTKEVSVSIETDGKNVIVKVGDDGDGVAEEKRHKIFELFGSNSNDGNGIGLSNAKHITELHGGSIVLESEVGKGSTFVVTLPTEWAV